MSSRRDPCTWGRAGYYGTPGPRRGFGVLREARGCFPCDLLLHLFDHVTDQYTAGSNGRTAPQDRSQQFFAILIYKGHARQIYQQRLLARRRVEWCRQVDGLNKPNLQKTLLLK